MEPDEVARWVGFVVDGGRLVVWGAQREPLLAALNLTPGDEIVRGLGPSGEEVEVPVVTGVGYVRWRIAGRCVAVAGPRDLGWVGYVGSRALVPGTVVGRRNWLLEPWS